MSGKDPISSSFRQTRSLQKQPKLPGINLLDYVEPSDVHSEAGKFVQQQVVVKPDQLRYISEKNKQ
jgi:hypothetical protein